MLRFFHASNSRSTRILNLIEEMGIEDQLELCPVTIPRVDGSGRRDPGNPHPEGKAPCITHGEDMVTETGAIMLYLTDLFPGTGLGPLPGEPGRGAYLTWLNWYHGVMEPVLIMQAGGVHHPWLEAAMRGPAEVEARIRAALDQGPWLLGARFSAADILIHSPYGFFPESLPDDPLIRDWAGRVAARPAAQRSLARDSAIMDAQAAA